ncbi:MAG: hypothetical protein EAZ92_11415 [Candidatus Kapaibacterium sp.]|nr:MAG: hypothetical protein EAZ92_11415 [Candidatus Kapabacteria bacterium]
MILNINDIKNGLPGITPVAGAFLHEGCVVCLAHQNHNGAGTTFPVSGDAAKNYTLVWTDIYSEELDRAWKDQIDATEYGAVCLAVLLALKLTKYTIIEKSVRKTGFDYWLGDKDDILFQKKARLEISGIFQGNKTELNRRYNIKLQQTNLSDNLRLPAYIGVVEFGRPTAKFGEKK